MKTSKLQLKNREPLIRLLSTLMLVVGLIFVVSSCCKDDVPEPKPEKVVIMFGVDSGEGGLEATVDGAKIVSRTEIEKGKTVIFKASHSKSWQIEYWTVNGTRIRSIEPEQTFDGVTEHLDVRVAFKKWVITPNE